MITREDVYRSLAGGLLGALAAAIVIELVKAVKLTDQLMTAGAAMDAEIERMMAAGRAGAHLEGYQLGVAHTAAAMFKATQQAAPGPLGATVEIEEAHPEEAELVKTHGFVDRRRTLLPSGWRCANCHDEIKPGLRCDRGNCLWARTDRGGLVVMSAIHPGAPWVPLRALDVVASAPAAEAGE